MNRHDHNIFSNTQARLKYLDADFQVIQRGDHVRCAVSGRRIPLDDLRYWSVELQEAYESAEMAMRRYLELARD